MYKYINGYNYDKTMAKIKEFNNNTRALSVDGMACSYLNSEGNRCAIGCFLPDKSLSLKYNGNVENLLKLFPDIMSYMPLQIEGLIGLQRVHDHGMIIRDIYTDISLWLKENVEE